MTTPVPATGLPPAPSIKHTLLEKLAIPAAFVAVGYLLGFMHGNTRGKRKAASSAV